MAGQLVAHKTAQQSWPAQGNRELPIALDFAASGVVTGDLYQQMSGSQIESIQSVYIDNSLNSTSFTLQFPITQQIIFVQPFMQGIFPVIEPGSIRYTARSNSGGTVPIIFSNTSKNYATWGPTPGINIVPPLTNKGIVPTALIVGDNVLLAGVPAQTIKLYRGIFEVDSPTNLLFTDGPGGTVLFSAALTAGGAITFEPSGAPWFNTSAGNSLILNSSAIANLYGGWGYVQS